MNINKWNEIYLNNKRLDEIFFEKYSNDEIHFKKNCIEVLVELGEFINETKIFKYWSIKKPDKQKVLEEYADVITMTLYFYNILDLEINKDINHINSDDILEVLNYLYQQMSKLMTNEYNKDLVVDIFNNLIYVSKLLNITEDEILESISKKHKIIEERLNSKY